jgi:hypothetical protein
MQIWKYFKKKYVQNLIKQFVLIYYDSYWSKFRMKTPIKLIKFPQQRLHEGH